MKIIIMGIQGSGKSTQGKLLAQKLDVPYLSTGHIFREIAKEDSLWGKYVRGIMNKGDLIPDEKTLPIVEEYLQKKEYQKGYVLDGFPRTLYQTQNFKESLDKVFYVKVGDQEGKRRLLERTKIEKREDDTSEAIDKRMKIYHELTDPVLEFYRQKGILVEVDGERSVEEIHQEITNNL